MSFQHTGSESDPGAARQRSASEQWGPWSTDSSGEDTQPRPAISEPSAAPRPDGAAQPLDAQFAIREHVTGQLTVHPADAPLFRPAYNPYVQLPPSQGPGLPKASLIHPTRAGQAHAPTIRHLQPTTGMDTVIPMATHIMDGSRVPNATATSLRSASSLPSARDWRCWVAWPARSS